MNLRPYYPVLRGTSLLRGMRDDELDKMLDCFAPRVRRYQKGEFLMLAGYETKEVGILLEGQITALKNTPDGSSVAITEMGTGGLFGDVLSGSSTKSPVSVMAQTDCLAIYLQDTFAVPLTRAGLAEYLNCDRSALSRELGRMQRDGLIETFRGSFKILDKERLRHQCQE